MKLFKSLLVAPATLGLLAPMSATANEINLADVSGYSSSEEIQSIGEFNPAKEIAVTNSRVDGLEARFNDLEAGSFSSTTSASFSVDMAIGALDGAAATSGMGNVMPERVEARYGFQIDLSTSFTGEDSLDISLDAGNGGGALSEFDMNSGGDGLSVDGVSYTFPLGDKTTVIFGDNTDGSALFSTACVYGGPSNTLDDCGAVNAGITGGGTAVGASYDIGSGFTGAIGYAGNGSGTDGLMTLQGDDAYGAQLTYTADTYGASITYGMTEASGVDTVSWALNGYWTPEGFPSISVGYETDNPEGTVIDKSSYFVGLSFDEVGPGSFGAALGTATPTQENADELIMYEAYYSYPVNDGVTLTPLVYVKQTAGTADDETGMMVKASFSF